MIRNWGQRVTITDLVVWGIGITIGIVVVVGSILTIRSGKYDPWVWIDLSIKGLALGGVYALIAMGYTLVYGVLRMINFAHSEVFMSGPFTAVFLANALANSGFMNEQPLLYLIAIFLLSMAVSMTIAILLEKIAYRPQAQAPAPTATQAAATATKAPAAGEAGTPSGEGTPLAGTEQAAAGAGTGQPSTAEPTTVARQGFGTVSGTIENKTGEALPAGLKVTLRGFDHGGDPSAGPAEVFTQEGVLEGDTYTFKDVEMPAGRIFLSEIEVDGMTLKSDFAIAEEGVSTVTIPAIPLYEMTDDTSLLAVDEVRMFLEYGENDIQVYGVYSFRNPSDKTILVDTKDNTEIPFIKSPEGTTTLGYDTLQDSERLLSTGKGLAIQPSEGSYGMLAFTTLPKQENYEVAQPLVLPATSFTVYRPEPRVWGVVRGETCAGVP